MLKALQHYCNYEQIALRLQQRQPQQFEAWRALLQQADFHAAGAVFELGCGDGYLAAHALRDYLPAHARYLAADVCAEMVDTTQKQLQEYGARVQVVQTRGEMTFPVGPNSYDRVVASNVLDRLSDEAVNGFLLEAYRVLQKDGLLCLTYQTSSNDWKTELEGWLLRLSNCLPAGMTPKLPSNWARPLSMNKRLTDQQWALEQHQQWEVNTRQQTMLIARKL